MERLCYSNEVKVVTKRGLGYQGERRKQRSSSEKMKWQVIPSIEEKSKHKH